MHRFYVRPENWNPDALTLSGPEAHHCRDVLRMKRGDKAVLFNGRGREITAEIVDLERTEVHLRKLHESNSPPLRCHITLGQAIPKGKNMELIVQKAVEIGASEIAPLISERTIVDLDPAVGGQKQAKWRQVSIEAAKQCGQNWLPYVHAPRKLSQFFSDLDPGAAVYDRRKDLESSNTTFDLRLIGSLQPSSNFRADIFPGACSCSLGRKAISRRLNLRSRRATAAARSPSAQLFFASKPPPFTASACCLTNCFSG